MMVVAADVKNLSDNLKKNSSLHKASSIQRYVWSNLVLDI